MPSGSGKRASPRPPTERVSALRAASCTLAASPEDGILSMGPLAGIKILDLSRVLAGPWATQMLADLGAEVVKIERPQGGDETRAWGPPYLKDGDGRDTSEVRLLSQHQSRQALGRHRLRNRRGPAAGARARAAIRRAGRELQGGRHREISDSAWEDLAPLNPRLIYCSISAFGQSGPAGARIGLRRDDPGHGRTDERHRSCRMGSPAAGHRKSASQSPT